MNSGSNFLQFGEIAITWVILSPNLCDKNAEKTIGVRGGRGEGRRRGERRERGGEGELGDHLLTLLNGLLYKQSNTCLNYLFTKS